MPAPPVFARPKVALRESFQAALVRMGGKLAAAPPDGDLQALIERLFPAAETVCSATAEITGNRPIGPETQPTEMADVEVGIVRAAFGVAETGSVWLSDRDFKLSSLGFLVQHLVVLLDPARIVADIQEAYLERSPFDACYGVFMTGPSATADIEGVLIHGAQGIRTLTAVLMPISRRAMP